MTGIQLLRRYPVLSEMIERLVTALHLERIYLFGSQARGEETPDSDFDLLLVVPESSLPRYRRDQEAFRAVIGRIPQREILTLPD